MTRRPLLLAAIAASPSPSSRRRPRDRAAAQRRAPSPPPTTRAPSGSWATTRRRWSSAPPCAPVWLAGDRFWYRNAIPEGSEFVLVDPARRTRERAFDHARLAAALSRAADTTLDAFHLPFQTFVFSADGRSIGFDAARPPLDLRPWPATACTGEPRRRERAAPQRRALARQHQGRLHPRLQPVGAGRGQRPRDAAHHRRREGLRLRHRQRRLDAERPADPRLVARLAEDRHVPAGRARRGRDVPGRARGWAIRCSSSGTTRSPATASSPRSSASIIDLDGPRVVRLQMPPDQHRSTLCDHVACGGALGRRRSGARRLAAGVRVHLARPPGRERSAWPTRRRARSARCTRSGWPTSSSRASTA